MPEPDENKNIPVFPTLVIQSARNTAMLEVLILAVGELLATSRGITNEEMVNTMHEEVEERTQEILRDAAAKDAQ